MTQKKDHSGGSEHDELPWFAERSSQRDRGAEDRTDGGGSGAAEECGGAIVVTKTVEVACADEDEYE